MNRNVYDDWNADGTLPEMKSCPFCRGKAILCDNGYERPVIDPETGAYIDMDMFDGDVLWCECQECGAESGYADVPEKAIALWNRRDNPPNDPITLDELREMDGEPVYCRSLLTGKEGWAICRVVECGGEWYLAFSGGEQAYGDKDTIWKNWLAYRRKPEEETK